MDAAESVLAGVEVALMNGSGRNILETAASDADGRFSFDAVRPGSYMLRVSAPVSCQVKNSLRSR